MAGRILSPFREPKCPWAFFNLSLETIRRHLTRSVIEGVAFNSRAAPGTVEKFIGRKFDSLRFAGGGVRSDVWARSYADILKIPIHQMADPVQVTCKGAGLIVARDEKPTKRSFFKGNVINAAFSDSIHMHP